ncbi:hypothetical protein DPMN_005696 [Dreissena polymorpha]|uniref:Uncharacterized protein n=1 Tax=Dreissena polymorpha TaxID=45954 RepID=A0A9D4MU34_DREPO|nr:hypothetical protein DPMN_005696 [Dreissena polymorpha]
MDPDTKQARHNTYLGNGVSATDGSDEDVNFKLVKAKYAFNTQGQSGKQHPSLLAVN